MNSKQMVKDMEATHPATVAFARSASQRIELVGFDPMIILTIIGFLFQFLVKCRQPQNAAAVRKQVLRYWVESKGVYKRDIINRVSNQADKAGKRAGRELTYAESRLFALAALDEVRLGDVEQMEAGIQEIKEAD